MLRTEQLKLDGVFRWCKCLQVRQGNLHEVSSSLNEYPIHTALVPHLNKKKLSRLLSLKLEIKITFSTYPWSRGRLGWV